MKQFAFIAALVMCVVVSNQAFAQTSNATLGGTVSDATGALIPGVSVTATNTGTGIVSTVISNEAGAYQFASLQTGAYRVSAELPGFQTAAFEGVALGISQQVRLNFTLQVGSVSQAVEVTVAADTLIATSSSSVGSVLPEYKVRDLPLGGRNVMDLVTTSAGVSNAMNTAGSGLGGFEGDTGIFAGGRFSAVNTTRDGFVVTDGRYLDGAFSVTYTSSDLVEEVRVITAPVDAEAGRGSGQVQMVTRSGSNQFRGSLFWNNKNSALYASNWFNNFNGVQKDWENRNQFGGRLGGPIFKNKTFFFVLVDEQRDIFKQTFVGAVLTPQARQGVFRFFPGADNQNANGNSPTVDRNGNAVRPANATADLQQFSVFNRDPFRPGFDPTGLVQNSVLAAMPMPNDYTTCGPTATGTNCDGLNVAGIRWTRRISGFDSSGAGNQSDQLNRDQFNTRIDHNFNANHKLSVVYTWERNLNQGTQAGLPGWPGGNSGANWRWPKVFTTSFVSTLSPNLVNELRGGYKTTLRYQWAPWYVGRFDERDEPNEQGKKAFAALPQKNGIAYNTVFTLFPDTNLNQQTSFNAGTTSFSDSPAYSLADTLSWSHGTHAFKLGGEWRFGYTNGGNDTNMTPLVTFGAGGPAVQGIDNVSIPGLSANNQTTARNLLTDLSGSIASIRQGWDLRDPKNPAFVGYTDGVKMRLRDWRASEFAWFAKDSWKMRSDFTLNYGIHWEWFGTPYERLGRAGVPVGGGEKGLCGVSCGALTTIEFVGKNSPNPDKLAYPNTWTNYAPSIGFSWSIPWFGKDKTVLRGGYGWSYTGGPLKNAQSAVAGILSPPGTFEGSSNNGVTFTQAGYLSLANATLPIPHQLSPLQTSPLDGTRAETIQAYARDRRDPYIQNFNLSIQRELGQGLTMDLAYIGTKGTSLWGGIQLNTVDVFKNQFLDAFNVTRAGGNAPMFDQMLRGLNIPGAGVVNGTTITGSAALRAFTSTRAFIANGNIGQLANFLNSSTAITGKGGGFVRNSGLFPENFFVLNPQFSVVTLNANPGSSTYHSMQLQVTKRLSQGFTAQGSYTFSRSLGENDNDTAIDYRDPNKRSLNKALLGFHRTHGFQSNGTLELPFGPNRRFLANAPGVVQRIVERWQVGGILSWFSGAPISVFAPLSTMTQATSVSTPNIVGDFPKSSGKVTKVANGVIYFPGIQQVTDPSAASVSALNALSGSFSNRAITDAQGKLLLTNPAPGQIGNMGLRWLEGPNSLSLNLNLVKRIRITETKEFEFRADAVNALNHPIFAPPTVANLSINSTSFGRITTAGGDRKITIGARLNF